MLVFHLILIAGLCYVLGRSSRIVARSVRRLGSALGVGQFALAFVLLGLATSMPEISVALFSVVRGVPGLTLGNLLGANIVILSLLTGIATVIAGGIKVGPFYKGNVFSLFVLAIAAPALVVLDGRVTRPEGFLLVGAYLFFMWRFYLRRQEYRPLHAHHARAATDVKGETVRGALAVAALLGASWLLVRIAVTVAGEAGFTPLIIGLLMLSIGTNMPEFTFVITQARGKDKDVVLGDLFGSVLLNTPTLGVVAIMSPFTIVAREQALVAAGALFLLLAVFSFFAWTNREISRREGAILVGFYVLFLLQSIGAFGPV